MNIRDIAVMKPQASSQRKTAFGENSFLAIGKKGQTVEGTISTVSHRISINFNGVEVSVSKSAVQNAREGETRQFRIMDVSKDSIVLKEVGRNTDSGAHILMGTTVSASSYETPDFKESLKTAQAGQQAGQDIQVMTGEDYQALESEEGALEEYKESTLDRAVERMKEQRQWKQERMEEYREFRQETQENLERMQALGFLEQKTPEQIAAALEEADLPAQQADVSRVMAALSMSQVAMELSESAKVYLIQNNRPLTIENLYHGQYSGAEGMTAGQLDEVTWQELLPQVEQLLEENGLKDEASLDNARWLFANELPVTVEALDTLASLEELQKNLTPDKALGQIIQALGSGNAPEQAVLDDREFVVARSILEKIESVTDQDILRTVQGAGTAVEITLQQLLTGKEDMESSPSGEKASQEGQAGREAVIPTVIAPEMSQEQIQAITARRQLEEIRLKMTLQSAVRMMDKGISIETTGLGKLVQELRDMETEYYTYLQQDRVGNGQTEAAGQPGLFQEVLEKRGDIQNAPAAMLGSSLRQQSLLTVNQLHRAAVSATVQMQQYQEDYEKVGTQVRSDLGDSIQKAFANVPSLLEELGMEDTQANQRAVRILGYNQMELTPENIARIKEYDAKVNDMLEGMKPSVVMELLRQGENPLDMTLDEVNSRIHEIAKERDIAPEEKYSRYLWQLEQNQEITPQERDGYIGIYRLLHQIEKLEGAAVGAVLDSGREMTLGNLLSAVRTRGRQGMDIGIDEEFGGLEEISSPGVSISQQIRQNYEGQDAPQQDQHRQEQPSENPAAWYYQRQAEELLREVTPERIREITDGDMEQLLNTSLEKLVEQMKAQEQDPIRQEMYRQKAQQLRELAEHSEEAVQFLEKAGLPETIANIQSVQEVILGEVSPRKELYGRRKVLDPEEQEAYEALLEEIPDSMDSREELQELLGRARQYEEQILEKSYQQKEMDSEEGFHLNTLYRGIRLGGSLARRQSYSIPLRTGETVTEMNVTVIPGTGDTGKVQISMDQAGMGEFGSISIELSLAGKEVKGLLLCDQRSGYDALREGQEGLEEQLEQQGFQVKYLSFGMDHRSLGDMMEKLGQEEQADTADLYQLAKCMVRFVADKIKI